MDEIADAITNAISKPNKVIYVNDNEEKIVDEKTVITRKLSTYGEELIKLYGDEIEKLRVFCLIQENLKKLKSSINKNLEEFFYDACIIIHDAILHSKAEKISIEQAKAINFVLLKLNGTIDQNDFYEIDTILQDNALDWIPDLEDFDDEE